MHRLRMALALTFPTLRAARGTPFLAAAGTGLAVVGVPAAMSVVLGPDELTMLLRVAAVCAGVGVVFLLDDPAKPTVETSPAPPWLTVAVRAAGALVATAAWWAAAVAITLTGAADGVRDSVPVRGLTLEAATVVAVALAVSVCGWRAADRGIGSTLAAPALLALLTAVALLPDHVALVVGMADPRWAAAHERWGLLLTVAVLAVPLAATLRRRRRRAWPNSPR